jgi:hypothetical protein
MRPLFVAASALSVVVGILTVLEVSATTWLIVGGAFVVVSALVVWLRQASDLVAWMRTIRPMPIAYVSDRTRVKLVGTVSCLGAPLVGPASERSCAAWQLSISQQGYRTSHDGSTSSESPVAIDKSESTGAVGNPYKPKRCLDIVIDDGSGTATIHASAESTMLYLSEDGQLKNNKTSEGVRGVETRLASDGLIVKWLGKGGIACFNEAILHIGSRVAVVGTCYREVGPDGERNLVMKASDKVEDSIVVCDDAEVVAVNPRNPAPGFRMSPVDSEKSGTDAA